MISILYIALFLCLLLIIMGVILCITYNTIIFVVSIISGIIFLLIVLKMIKEE